MRVTLEGHSAELRSLLAAEPPTQELPAVKPDRLPLWVHWLAAAGVTVVVFVLVPAIVGAVL